MLVYSTTINAFRKKMRSLAIEIMRDEMQLNLSTGASVLWGSTIVDLEFGIFENDNKINNTIP